MRRSFLLSGVVLGLVGCFAGSSTDTDAENETSTTSGDGDGDATTNGDGDGDATTNGDGDGDATTNGDGDGDMSTGSDAPPSAENFTIDGSATPPKLLQSKVVVLSVEAEDDMAVDSVEFFEDGQSIGLGTLVPLTSNEYAFEYIVSGEGFDGEHEYTVTVSDSGGQSVEAGPLAFEIDVPASGANSWTDVIDPTPNFDEVQDCLLPTDDTLVLVGDLGGRGMIMSIDTATGVETDTVLIGDPDEFWNVTEIEPGPNNGGFVTTRVLVASDNNHIEVVRRLDTGDIGWSTGPLRSNGNDSISTSGMATTNDLVYVGSDANGLPFELIILDMQSGEEQCSVIVEGTSDVYEMIPLDNGDVMLAGSAGFDGWFARYDQNCQEVFAVETLDGRYRGAWETDDGTIYVVGSNGNGPPTNRDAFIREISVEGTLGPLSEYDGFNSRDEWRAVAQTPNGNVILGGTSGPGDLDTGLYFRAESPIGQLLWDIEPIFGGFTTIHSVSELCLDRAGNTFVVGRLVEPNLNSTIWLGRYAP